MKDFNFSKSKSEISTQSRSSHIKIPGAKFEYKTGENDNFSFGELEFEDLNT